MPHAKKTEVPHLAARIRALREAKGVSQEALATACGVERTTLVRWESGKKVPDIYRLPCLAQQLGVEVWELFHPTGKRRKNGPENHD